MLKSLVLLIGLALGCNAYSQQVTYCQLHGSVYSSEDRSKADFIVFAEESEAFADFLVYKEENKLYADEPGLWFFVDNKGLADFSIYLTKNKGEADFVIYFTDSPTFVGCN